MIAVKAFIIQLAMEIFNGNGSFSLACKGDGLVVIIGLIQGIARKGKQVQGDGR